MAGNRIGADQWREWIGMGAERLSLVLDVEMINRLRHFADELIEANQAFNLTNITDPYEIAFNLMLDSMYPGKFIVPGARVLDLGTGAGFPGIPLKIAFPGLEITLIDSRRKRINFLKYVIRQLGLEGVRAEHVRAETLAERGEGAFDVVVCRAVSAIGTLVELSFPLLGEGGVLIAMKGSGYMRELEESGIRNASVETYRLPGLEMDRALVMLRRQGRGFGPVEKRS